jgi:hypothetical protein
MNLKDISAILKKKNNTVSHLINGLVRDGVVKKEGYGKYIFTESTECTESVPSIEYTESYQNKAKIQRKPQDSVEQTESLDADSASVLPSDSEIQHIESLRQKVKCTDCRHLNGSFCIAVRTDNKPHSWNGRRGQDPQLLHECGQFERVYLG